MAAHPPEPPSEFVLNHDLARFDPAFLVSLTDYIGSKTDLLATAGAFSGPAGGTGIRCQSILFLDMSGFLEELFLESGNIVQGGLGILFSGNGKVVLLLPLDKKLEELGNVPRVLLPIEARRPCPVPGTVGRIFRIHVHRLDGALTAGSS